MTAAQYTKSLKRLGLTPASRRTAHLLGISVRQSQRIAAGKCPVSPTLERLLILLGAAGKPADAKLGDGGYPTVDQREG